MQCPEVDLEEFIIHTLLSSLRQPDLPQEAMLETLAALQQVFKINYTQCERSFMRLDGISVMEQLLSAHASSLEIVEAILSLVAEVSKTIQYAQIMEHSNMIPACIQVLLRYRNKKHLIKTALNITRALCIHGACACAVSAVDSSASTLIPYLSTLQSILKDYSSSASICDCITHILVRVAQIGPQSRVSILKSGILANMDTVLIIHISRSSLVCNIMLLFSDLTEVPSGVTFLIESNCFSASLRAIDLCAKEESKEKCEVVCKALQFVQIVVAKNERVFNCFVKNGGFTTLMECWKKSGHFAQVRKEALICLGEVLQYEEGNAQLAAEKVLPTLLAEEEKHSTEYYLPEFWNAVNMFIQFHSALLTSDDCDLLLLLATRSLAQDAQDAQHAEHAEHAQAELVVRPLFLLASASARALLPSPLDPMAFASSALAALLPLLEQRIAKETDTDLLLQLRFVYNTATQLQVTKIPSISEIEKNAAVLSSLEVSLPQLTSPTERLNILTSLSCICTRPEVCHQIARGCVPRVMLQWVRQEASDGLAIKAFTVLSALAEAGELAEEQAKEAVALITRRLSLADSISPDLLLVLAVFVEAASDSGGCVEWA